nr:MAG TPA: hypothetical protein [Bacteriophage sp.]
MLKEMYYMIIISLWLILIIVAILNIFFLLRETF